MYSPRENIRSSFLFENQCADIGGPSNVNHHLKIQSGLKDTFDLNPNKVRRTKYEELIDDNKENFIANNDQRLTSLHKALQLNSNKYKSDNYTDYDDSTVKYCGPK